MMINAKARAFLYIFTFALRALYILLAMWDDNFAAQGWDGIIDTDSIKDIMPMA